MEGVGERRGGGLRGCSGGAETAERPVLLPPSPALLSTLSSMSALCSLAFSLSCVRRESYCQGKDAKRATPALGCCGEADTPEMLLNTVSRESSRCLHPNRFSQHTQKKGITKNTVHPDCLSQALDIHFKPQKPTKDTHTSTEYVCGVNILYTVYHIYICAEIYNSI